MRRRSPAAIALIAAIAAAPPPARAETAAGATLRIEVSSLKNRQGTLRCGLYASAAMFPDGVGTRATAVITGSTAACTFEGVAPGTYAVAVFHDANDNGVLDKSFLGLPKEGYGVSNNQLHTLSGPKWNESKFTVGAGETKVLPITLHY